MSEDYVPRAEFEMFCNQQRESSQRIEAGLTLINNKLDGMTTCVNDRVTWEAHDRHRQECKEEFVKLRGRPSWAVVAIFGFLQAAFFTVLTMYLARIL